jgi:hypothetical protein
MRGPLQPTGLLIAAVLLLSFIAAGQEIPIAADNLKDSALKVFLDGSGFDQNYIRTEITFVNYVRQRQDADIHILGTQQRTGSAGNEYLIEFIGLKDFAPIHFTLTYYSNRLDTWDQVRSGMVRILKKGLMPFIAHTPLEDKVSVLYKGAPEPTAVEDKWDFWIFSLGADVSLNGQKSYKSQNFSGNFSVSRTTEDLKFSAALKAHVNNSSFVYDEEELDTSRESWDFGSILVKSLGSHWAAGFWVGASSSSYSNEKYSLQAAPAIEYDVFPYEVFTRKKLILRYFIKFGRHTYMEETIFDKTRETLVQQNLTVDFQLRQPWGSISTSLSGSHYLHDFSKNRLEIHSYVSLRIIKGFSFNLYGGFSMIHDQLSLVKAGLSHEEVLLHLKELSTTYNYYLSFGISYSFGSVYSNVVNPRFGAGSLY